MSKFLVVAVALAGITGAVPALACCGQTEAADSSLSSYSHFPRAGQNNNATSNEAAVERVQRQLPVQQAQEGRVVQANPANPNLGGNACN